MSMATATCSLALFCSVSTAFLVVGHSAVCHPLRHTAVGIVQAKSIGFVLPALDGADLVIDAVDYFPLTVLFSYGLVCDVCVLAQIRGLVAKKVVCFAACSGYVFPLCLCRNSIRCFRLLA